MALPQSNISVILWIIALEANIGPNCEILKDLTDTNFQQYTKRWSDIDRQIPVAIVLPRTEKDIQKVVQWAVKLSLPFVTKSGGGSEWSTIGDNGLVIDLTHYLAIEVDEKACTVTIRGGVLQKEAAVHLAEEGLFTALGNGNVVGVTEYVLGGGSAITNSITGFESDQIISAQLVTAKGELLEVTQDLQPDLLWALCGAGHFFRLVMQLVIKAYPVSLLGSKNGTIWAGSFIFPLDQARDVANAMKYLMDDSRYVTSGLIMTMAPLPARKSSIVISARYTGDPAGAEEAYKPLYNLKPLIANGLQVPIQNISDGREAIGVKGDFKRFGIVGLHRFDITSFLKTIEVWKELVAECPDAINTAFNFQWDSRPVKTLSFDSAMCLHDTRFYQNNLIWHTNLKNCSKVDEYNEKCLMIMRGPNTSEWADYQNATRSGPIELWFRGKDRLVRLQRLKKEWDSTGVFTAQLLE